MLWCAEFVRLWPPVPAQTPAVTSVTGFAACFAEEVTLDVEDLGLPAEVDVLVLQHRHQLFGELLLLLARLPDLAYVQIPA